MKNPQPTQEGVTFKTEDVDGPLHYADFGGSGTPLVLVHGLGGSHLNWMAVGSLLARYARVFAVDLVGFGRTPPAGRKSDVATNQRLVVRFLEKVVGGPAVLVGNSMGGAISMRVASSEPGKVRGLVLVNPAMAKPRHVPLDPEAARMFGLYALPGVGEAYLRYRYLTLGPAGVVTEQLKLCCADFGRLSPELVQSHIRLAEDRKQMGWALKSFLQAARSVIWLVTKEQPYYEMMRSISCPTLLLHGRQDRLVPVGAAENAAKLCPEWNVDLIPDMGHVPMMEAPQRFVDSVACWLEATGLHQGPQTARTESMPPGATPVRPTQASARA